jgi:hypothetical protein
MVLLVPGREEKRVVPRVVFRTDWAAVARPVRLLCVGAVGE